MDDLVKEVTQKIVTIEVEDIGLRYMKVCKVCQAEFLLVDFTAHEKSHSIDLVNEEEGPVNELEDDYLCSICGETFSKESQFRIHQIQKHSSSLVVILTKTPLLQEACRRRLALDWNENETKTKLTKSKRFKCCYCEKSFVLSSQCRSHENAHAENIIKIVEEGSIPTIKYEAQNDVVNSLELESVGTEVVVLPSTTINQVEITTNEISAITSAPSGSSVEEEEVKTNPEKMEFQSAISGTFIEEIMEMPALISPIKLEPIELTQLPELVNFETALENMSSFATNLGFSTVAIESKPLSYDQPVTTTTLKEEVEVNNYDFTNVVTNGDISSEQCKETFHKCLTCNELFPESQLFLHIKSHLGKGQKECTICAYKAVASGDLRHHMNKHYNIKPYKCPICPNSYGWQSGWKKHMTTHSRDQKLFKCTHCKHHCSTQRERRRHELIHQNINGPSPLKLKKNERTNSKKEQSVDFKPESEIHGNGEGAYEPQIQFDYTPQHEEQQQEEYNAPFQQPQDFIHNSQSYYNNEGLYNNQNYAQEPTHAHLGNSWDSAQVPPPDYGNYSLSYANQGTGEVQNQNQNWTELLLGDQNTNSNDTDVELEKIEETHKQFREPDDLRENETCKTCGEVIVMTELRAHIQSHILPGQKACTICKYKCNTRVYLEEHYNIHYGLKPYTCTVCKRKFAMRSYLRSHTQQVHDSESTRRYQCRYCNKRFVRPCHKRTHEKIHEGQTELHPSTTSSTVSHDSDSSSNSNHSHRPPTTTSDRGSTTSSPSIFSTYGNSPAKSPHSASMTPSTTPNPESQWNNGHVTPTRTQQPQTPWSYWSGNNYSGSEFQQSIGYEQSSWMQGNHYNSPIVKSDVNWTEPLSESSPWLQNQGQSQAYSHIKSEQGWGDSSSSGFHSTSTSTSTSSLPPSAAVQDLWAELQYEEMKWLPETSTVYTADGIPMITEFAPFEGSFSYTDMLNSATADLPIFGSTAVPEQSDEQVQNETMKALGPVPLSNFDEVLQKDEKVSPSGWKGQVPRPKRNFKGRGKGKLTAEAKHKRILSFEKSAEIVENDVDISLESLAPSSPKADESSGDEEPEEPDSLMKCLTCQVDIVRRDLLVHIRDHLLPGQRTCDLCQRTYCNPLTLREHIHVHYNLKPHKCSFCEARFSTRYSLKTHETFTHEEGKTSILKCPDCGKLFAIRNEFHKHLKTHEDKNGMTHGTKKERRSTVEMEVEAKEREAQIKDAKSKTWEVRVLDVGRIMKKKCPLCDEEILLADFFEHKYSHRDPCHICQKPILCTEVLYHGPTHIGSEIQCEICGWKAQQRSQLWEHMNGHMKVKPIRCLYCGSGFASRNSLRSHYLSIHTTFRPHKCRYCDKTFVQGTTMRQHELTHFGTQCPACPQSFTFRKDLRLHLRGVHKFDY